MKLWRKFRNRKRPQSLSDLHPRDLPEALAMVEQWLRDQNLWKQLSTMEMTDFHYLHFSFGRTMRNEMGLWRAETPLVVWFEKTYGLSHADDIYSIIMTSLYNKAQGLPMGVEERIEKHRRYWDDLSRHT